jgi:hypothetical protein
MFVDGTSRRDVVQVESCFYILKIRRDVVQIESFFYILKISDPDPLRVLTVPDPRIRNPELYVKPMTYRSTRSETLCYTILNGILVVFYSPSLDHREPR